MDKGTYGLDSFASENYVLAETPWLMCESMGKKKKKKKKKKHKKQKKTKAKKRKSKNLSEMLIEKAADTALQAVSDAWHMYLEAKFK